MSYGCGLFQKCVRHKKCHTFLAPGLHRHLIPIMSKKKIGKLEMCASG